MKWVTRERIRVNRTATCWLIRRVLDSEAELSFVLADEVVKVQVAADFKDQLDSHPAARGLALISHGFPLVTKDDHETAQHASFLYDALYVSLKEANN